MKTLITLIVLALGTAVLAHSSLVSSTPADGSTVSKRSTSISLMFSEEVETGFSSFVVYSLGKADADHEALESEVAPYGPGTGNLRRDVARLIGRHAHPPRLYGLYPSALNGKFTTFLQTHFRARPYAAHNQEAHHD